MQYTVWVSSRRINHVVIFVRCIHICAFIINVIAVFVDKASCFKNSVFTVWERFPCIIVAIFEMLWIIITVECECYIITHINWKWYLQSVISANTCAVINKWFCIDVFSFVSAIRNYIVNKLTVLNYFKAFIFRNLFCITCYHVWFINKVAICSFVIVPVAVVFSCSISEVCCTVFSPAAVVFFSLELNLNFFVRMKIKMFGVMSVPAFLHRNIKIFGFGICAFCINILPVLFRIEENIDYSVLIGENVLSAAVVLWIVDISGLKTFFRQKIETIIITFEFRIRICSADIYIISGSIAFGKNRNSPFVIILIAPVFSCFSVINDKISCDCLIFDTRNSFHFTALTIHQLKLRSILCGIVVFVFSVIVVVTEDYTGFKGHVFDFCYIGIRWDDC